MQGSYVTVTLGVIGLCCLCSTVDAAIPAFSPSARVSDTELSRMRGGILLPNGFDVAIGLDIQTRVDGELALRTVLNSDNAGASGLRIFTDGYSPDEPMPGSVDVDGIPASGPDIVVDRGGTGTTVTGSDNTTVPRVTVTSAPTAQWPSYDREQEVSPQPNGAGIQTDLGTVRLDTTDATTVVSLTNPSLLVRHMIGQATGVTVANTANNRNIETTTGINLDLGGVWPIFSNNLLAINDIAAEAAARN